MLRRYKAWRRTRILAAAAVPDEAWQKTLRRVPVLRRLSTQDAHRLRQLATLFLHEKTLSAAGGLALTDALRLAIAAQACLPILNLGLDHYGDWREVVVYPDEFLPQHEYTDDAGVVHVTRHPTMGEAWLQGPVVLSAADVLRDDGVNVVIHECAHKLDMRNGDANGFPPLHKDMDAAAWSRSFTAAYAHFCAQLDAGVDPAIDPYAAEGPDEFFAVLSETFFEAPQRVYDAYVDVYRQLVLFYRQDPLAPPRPPTKVG